MRGLLSRFGRVFGDPMLWGFFYGACAFYLLYGFTKLMPGNIGWSMSGDGAIHYLGWSVFRDDPWTWPLGVIQSLESPIGTSIVYTDSLPLFAIPLKVIEGWLPEPFQYRGLWLFLCYVLMGGGALRLIYHVSGSLLSAYIGCSFFLLSPVVTLRFIGHDTLAAHWILVWGLYFYATRYRGCRNLYWGGLCCIAALVHFYLLFMLMALWAAYFIQILIAKREIHVLRAFSMVALHVSALLFVMWGAGYFVVPLSSSGSGGFGLYSMNLNALWNPDVASRFLDDQPLLTFEQWEGFNYLGLGTLILLVYSMLSLRYPVYGSLFKRHWPLVLVSVALFLLAVSNRIAFGETLLVDLPLPVVVEESLGIVRASGRLFWPVYYLLLLFPWVIAKWSRFPNAIWVFGIITLIVQIVDLEGYFQRLKNWNPEWETSLRSPVWATLFEGKKEIVFVPTDISLDALIPFGVEVARRDIRMNTTYAARFDESRRKIETERRLEELASDEVKEDALYVFQGNLMIAPDLNRPMTFGKLDGFNVLSVGQQLDHPDILEWPYVMKVEGAERHLADLFADLEDGEYLVVSVRDDAAYSLTMNMRNFFAVKGLELENLGYRGSYCLVWSNNGILEEALNNNGPSEVKLVVGDMSLVVESGGQPWGNFSNISLNGINISPEARGVNAVLINWRTKEVRRYAFDTCIYENPLSTAR